MDGLPDELPSMSEHSDFDTPADGVYRAGRIAGLKEAAEIMQGHIKQFAPITWRADRLTTIMLDSIEARISSFSPEKGE